MKKYLFILLSVIIIILCACDSGQSTHEDLSSKYPELFESESFDDGEELVGDGKLIINNIETEIKAKIYKTNAEIPLVSVLSELGYMIEWNNDVIATLSDNQKTYILDLNAKSIVEENQSDNLIVKTNREDYKCFVEGKEIILDQVSFYSTMKKLGSPISYNLNYEEMIITINTK